jgi:hypothetical protein
MSAVIEPGAAPDHQCINAACGCNDQVSAGPCSEFCSAHTVEASDLARGDAALEPCGCGHDLCRKNEAGRGTPERGLS